LFNKNFYAPLAWSNLEEEFKLSKIKDEVHVNEESLYDLFISSDHHFDDLGILRPDKKGMNLPSVYDKYYDKILGKKSKLVKGVV
jgi:hypothetical protein